MDTRQKTLIVLQYSMIFFSIIIYSDRILVNDVAMRFQFILKDYDYGERFKWLEIFINFHAILYNVTDFVGGCIQLYLTTWFTPEMTSNPQLTRSQCQDMSFDLSANAMHKQSEIEKEAYQKLNQHKIQMDSDPSTQRNSFLGGAAASGEPINRMFSDMLMKRENSLFKK